MGLSVFWIYLLGESVIRASDTDASRITPIALVLALSQLLLSLRMSSRLTSGTDTESQVTLSLEPVISLPVTALISTLSFGVILSWTASLRIALFFSALILASLITIYLESSASLPWVIRYLKRKWLAFHLAIVIIFTVLIIYLINRVPETVIDRSDLTLWFSPIPLFIFSILNLLSAAGREKAELQ